MNLSKFWCTTTNRNYWVSTINVGGAVEVPDAFNVIHK